MAAHCCAAVMSILSRTSLNAVVSMLITLDRVPFPIVIEAVGPVAFEPVMDIGTACSIHPVVCAFHETSDVGDRPQFCGQTVSARRLPAAPSRLGRCINRSTKWKLTCCTNSVDWPRSSSYFVEMQ
jgi:hypothetical protein